MDKLPIHLIMHFYNEEYLLPFWIDYHKSLPLESVTLIDYHSTDKSMEIIKELAPSGWNVITSRNHNFDAENCDREVMDIESEFNTGWKLCLNTTEFLMVPKNANDILTYSTQGVMAHACESVVITGNELDLVRFPKSQKRMFKYPANIKEFLLGFRRGVFGHRLTSGSLVRAPRYIHNSQNGQYSVGRHKTNLPTHQNNSMFICWAGYFPWNMKTLNRKLQIQTQIPESDSRRGRGFHHFWSIQELYNVREQLVNASEDLMLLDAYNASYENVLNLL